MYADGGVRKLLVSKYMNAVAEQKGYGEQKGCGAQLKKGTVLRTINGALRFWCYFFFCF